MVSPADQDFNELSPRKQHPFQEWESDSIQFTDGDYVIMQSGAKNITLLAVRQSKSYKVPYGKEKRQRYNTDFN